MLNMILNGNVEQEIEITSYSRSINLNDPAIKFNLNISMTGSYSPMSVEYLAQYGDEKIVSIQINNEVGETLVLSDNLNAQLRSLNENCDANGRYAYAEIINYAEPAVEEEEAAEEEQ